MAFLRHQLLVLKRSAPVADAGLSLKKACAPASKTGPTSRADGTNGKQHQDKVDPKRLVFIDETWMKTNMSRTHGRCPRGQRLVAKVPHGHWKTLTFVAALRSEGITAP